MYLIFRRLDPDLSDIHPAYSNLKMIYHLIVTYPRQIKIMQFIEFELASRCKNQKFFWKQLDTSGIRKLHQL